MKTLSKRSTQSMNNSIIKQLLNFVQVELLVLSDVFITRYPPSQNLKLLKKKKTPSYFLILHITQVFKITIHLPSIQNTNYSKSSIPFKRINLKMMTKTIQMFLNKVLAPDKLVP